MLIREQNQRLGCAYMTAVLMRWDTRKKAFPELRSMLIDATPKRELTVEELWQRNLAVVRAQKKIN